MREKSHPPIFTSVGARRDGRAVLTPAEPAATCQTMLEPHGADALGIEAYAARPATFFLKGLAP